MFYSGLIKNNNNHTCRMNLIYVNTNIKLIFNMYECVNCLIT